jgi:hypothetical protein
VNFKGNFLSFRNSVRNKIQLLRYCNSLYRIQYTSSNTVYGKNYSTCETDLAAFFAAVKAKRKTTTNSTATAAAAREEQQLLQQQQQLCASLLESLESYCRLPAGQQLAPIGDGGDLSCRLQLFLSTTASLAASLEQMVEFAKRVPGFLGLPSGLQLGLVKTNSLRLVLLCDLMLETSTPASTSALTSSSPPPFMTFLDGRYLTSSQGEALFSRDFVERYGRLKERCSAAASAMRPMATAFLGVDLLLLGGNIDQNDDATAVARGLAQQISMAAKSAISAADFVSIKSQFLPSVIATANEMLEFFKIFQSFCDSRQLPPVFVEVFDF